MTFYIENNIKNNDSKVLNPYYCKYFTQIKNKVKIQLTFVILSQFYMKPL